MLPHVTITSSHALEPYQNILELPPNSIFDHQLLIFGSSTLSILLQRHSNFPKNRGKALYPPVLESEQLFLNNINMLRLFCPATSSSHHESGKNRSLQDYYPHHCLQTSGCSLNIAVPSSQASKPHGPHISIHIPHPTKSHPSAKKHHLESPIIVLQTLNPPSYFFTTTFSGVAWLPWLAG